MSAFLEGYVTDEAGSLIRSLEIAQRADSKVTKDDFRLLCFIAADTLKAARAQWDRAQGKED